MNKIRRKASETSAPPVANFAAILAIVAEMARRVSVNISKVELAPIAGGLITRDEATPDSKV